MTNSVKHRLKLKNLEANLYSRGKYSDSNYLMKNHFDIIKDTTLKEFATFALGCFWGPDDYFSKLDGVIKTRVGYASGTTPNPTYHSLGDHTETVEITFNPSIISFKKLLNHFWRKHDSTIPQIKQYQSVIFFHNKKQKEIAEKNLEEKQHKTSGKILTNIQTAGTFYEAEEYHQKYYQKMNKEKMC